MQKWIKTNIASDLQFLKPVQSVVLSGYIRRCRTADAVYMVNEEGVAQQELRGAEAVIGLQLGIFAFEDGWPMNRHSTSSVATRGAGFRLT